MRLTILGATGSIGASTVDVVLRHPQLFSVYALVGHSNVERMIELAEQTRPQLVIMTDETAADRLAGRLPEGVTLQAGMAAAVAAASAPAVDMVMAAMVGAAGVPAALAAVEAGKRVGLANKECLVAAGGIFMAAAQRSGATIIPVDSEHAAVQQCLAGHDRSSIEQIILTASGGPFRDRDPDTLHDVTPEQAIAHPNWAMGAKISVDSATMANKVLELIEARWLFDMPPEKLSAIIHPQSIVHALVQYRDGSVLAQLAEPDMRAPIACALQMAPRLSSGTPFLDLTKRNTLTFQPVDEHRFPAMRLVRDVLAGHDSLAIAFNAANEEANAAFRQRQLRFTGIMAVVGRVVASFPNRSAATLEEVWRYDAQARDAARAIIGSH